MKTFLTIVQMLPGIIEAVKQAEFFISTPGQGQSKLTFILGIIEDTYPDAMTMIDAIKKIVGRVVDLANAAGVFKKA